MGRGMFLGLDERRCCRLIVTRQRNWDTSEFRICPHMSPIIGEMQYILTSYA